MTSKNRTTDILNKMDVIHYVKLSGKNSNSKGLPVSMYKDQIKKCALICIDEQLSLIKGLILKDFSLANNHALNSEIRELESIKNELNNVHIPQQNN